MDDRLKFLAPSNPLRRAGYRYLIYFSTIVAMGGGFHFIGSYWILYRETSSPASVAWLIMAYWVPSLFVMPFAGVLVDRWNRRLILASVCGYLALLSTTMTTLMATGLFRIEYLYPYGVLSSLALGVFWNALLGRYTSLEGGRLIHAAILRDSFVAASVVLLLLGIVSLFTAYPFLRRSIERGGSL